MIEKPYINEVELNFTKPAPKRGSTKTIILHHAAGKNLTVQQIHAIHINNGWNGIGYQFYIRMDGCIFQGRPIWASGIHTVGQNSSSVGICFEGNFQTDEMPEVQFNAGVKLVAWLLDNYNLSLNDLKEHRDFNATACPGLNFPSLQFRKAVKNYMERKKIDDTIPAGCEDACKWAVENGIVAGYGDGTFGWNEPVTLARMVTICERMIDKKRKL